ncbi:MAG: hypothetical protein ABSE28_05465 [Candidatus Sulfotelmatobacter sp.]
MVEFNTLKNEDPGYHGQLTLFGGTYDTAGINTQNQYTWNKNNRIYECCPDLAAEPEPTNDFQK